MGSENWLGFNVENEMIWPRLTGGDEWANRYSYSIWKFVINMMGNRCAICWICAKKNKQNLNQHAHTRAKWTSNRNKCRKELKNIEMVWRLARAPSKLSAHQNWKRSYSRYVVFSVFFSQSSKVQIEAKNICARAMMPPWPTGSSENAKN